MTLLQLQYFKTLARVLHYTHAAKELHIAQPSLSYSISELEKELDVKLFNKENRTVSLTMFKPLRIRQPFSSAFSKNCVLSGL